MNCVKSIKHVLKSAKMSIVQGITFGKSLVCPYCTKSARSWGHPTAHWTWIQVTVELCL